MKRVLMLAMMTAAGFPALNLPAMAQQPEQVIAFLDKTGDGKCDLNEYLAFQHPRFAQFDADKDGELNLPEFKESLQGESKKNARFLFDASNKETGRYLIEREFLGYHAWIFNTYVDTDKDGFMSAAEWAKITGRS
jgi:EF hand